MKAFSKCSLALLAMGCMVASATAQDKAAPIVPMPPAPIVSAPVILGSGSCDSGCCNSEPEHLWHPTFDVGFYVLKPMWSANPAAVTSGDTPTNNASLHNFDMGPQFVPRASLGVVSGSGLGFRTSFWSFADSNTVGIQSNTQPNAETPTPVGIQFPFIAFVGNGTNPLVTSATLRMEVWDFEVTQDFRAGQWDVQLGGGIRYAHISQSYNAVQFDTDGDSAFLNSAHSFNGAGPTASAEFARRIGNTGIALYGNVRGSILFGNEQQNAYSGFKEVGAAASLEGFGSDSADMIIPVGEVEMGVRYTRDIGRGRLFLKAGLVGMVWWGTGNSSRSGLSLSNEGESLSDLSASGDNTQKNDNLGLWGLSMTAGYQY